MATVLIVEDSDFQRSLIGSIARDSGHDVVAATNGREGLVAALEHEPDCIITDILMPEMDGLDMIDAMRARGQRAHVIVVSADIQDTTRERARALGVGGVPQQAGRGQGRDERAQRRPPWVTQRGKCSRLSSSTC